MKQISKFYFASITTGVALAAQICNADIPFGNSSVQVDDPLNPVWNFATITPLQTPYYSIENSDGDTDISFQAQFTHTPTGKLTGSGSTHVVVSGPFINGDFDGVYTVKGTVTGSRGITRLNYSASASGRTQIDGRASTLKTTFTVKGTMDNVNQSLTGTQTAAGAASGFGGSKSQRSLDVSWGEIMSFLGAGSWSLDLLLQNDGLKKLTGDATVHMSDGSELGFVVKGVYKSATDTSVLVLSATPDSKGSSLKVTMLGNAITSIKGKLAGQMVSVTNL